MIGDVKSSKFVEGRIVVNSKMKTEIIIKALDINLMRCRENFNKGNAMVKLATFYVFKTKIILIWSIRSPRVHANTR